MAFIDGIAEKEYHKVYNKEYYLKHRRRMMMQSVAASQVLREHKKSAKVCVQHGCWNPTDGERGRCLDCLRKFNSKSKNRKVALRDKVIQGYGSKCVCCLQGNKAFLTLDHINNDGGKDRASGNVGTVFLLSLIKENFPPHIQLLCYNCNMSKRDLGECSHQIELEATMVGDSTLRSLGVI